MGRRGRKNPLDFVQNVVAVGSRTLRDDLQLCEDQARMVMERIADAICDLYGGTAMYVPKDQERAREERDRQIWREYGLSSPTARCYTATRLAELADQYGYTEVHMYSIVGRQRELETRSRQPELPGLAQEDILSAC